MTKPLLLYIACAILFYTQSVSGQALVADSTATASVATDPAAYYHRLISESSGLYNGIEYKAHSPLILGSPFYLANDWSKGTVVYNQVLYKNVLIKYDAFADQLVALLFNEALPYVLNRTQVQSFDLLNHHFVYIEADSLQREYPAKSGFYNQLYNGKTEVLFKVSKSIENYSNINQNESRYIDKFTIYLRNRNNYYPISNNKSVLNALQDRKKEVQQYIKSNHLKISKNTMDALVQVAAYYDSLTR